MPDFPLCFFIISSALIAVYYFKGMGKRSSIGRKKTESKKSLLLIGEASTEIQAAKALLSESSWFPESPANKYLNEECDNGTETSLENICQLDVRTTKTTGSLSGDEAMFQYIVTQGIADYKSDVTAKNMKQAIKEEMQKMDTDGFHAAIVVMGYPIRWTDEAIRVTDVVVKVIGRENLQKYGILVLTRGLSFQIAYQQISQKKIDDYIDKIGAQAPKLKKFLDSFHKRVVMLDTETEDKIINEPQMSQMSDLHKGMKGTFKLPKNIFVRFWKRVHSLCCLSMSKLQRQE